jgi:pimeloyl-ACP methyl ester carboxylesterase
MAKVQANGISIEYESFGAETAEPILLIMGLGAQMTLWPVAFCETLAARGYRVIRFDNRDVGLSTHFVEAGVPDMGEVFASLAGGKAPKVPYTLDDMADDAVGVLDALHIPRAHIVGASMGGMIAQLVAADHPEHTLTLTSIMSTTGNPALPRATPEAMAVLTNRPPSPTEDEAAFLTHSVAAARVTGSPGYPAEEAALRERILADVKRAYNPTGFSRQMAAITATGDRREKLKHITAPTLVIHGEADPLVPLAGGQDTATSIPGAELLTLPGMGHDLPLALYDTLIDAIVGATRRAKAAA